MYFQVSGAFGSVVYYCCYYVAVVATVLCVCSACFRFVQNFIVIISIYTYSHDASNMPLFTHHSDLFLFFLISFHFISSFFLITFIVLLLLMLLLLQREMIWIHSTFTWNANISIFYASVLFSFDLHVKLPFEFIFHFEENKSIRILSLFFFPFVWILLK